MPGGRVWLEIMVFPQQRQEAGEGLLVAVLVYKSIFARAEAHGRALICDAMPHRGHQPSGDATPGGITTVAVPRHRTGPDGPQS